MKDLFLCSVDGLKLTALSSFIWPYDRRMFKRDLVKILIQRCLVLGGSNEGLTAFEPEIRIQ